MKAAPTDAWSFFWEREKLRGGGGGRVPPARQGMDAMQARAWQAFATKLPKRARVLDIATGDGWVMAKLRAARADLRLVGIDSAPVLPEPPEGTETRSGVDMRSLPFEAEQFDACTSQFGFEYGNMPDAAAELHRVLGPAGRLAILCHRAGSPIVEHNRKRREQIVWALDDRSVTQAARDALSQTDIDAVPEYLDNSPAIGAERFGSQSAAWEIAETVRRTMSARRTAPRSEIEAILNAIDDQASNELARIQSLENAAEAAGDGRKIDEILLSAGFEPQTHDALYDGAGNRAFGTFLTYVKPA